MKRNEAIAALKELVASNAVDASWILIEKMSIDDYQVKIKTTSLKVIKEFGAGRGLAVEVNEEKGICIIYKPPLT